MDLDPDDPRPVWLLDIDGVLNVSRNPWGEAPFTATVPWLGASRVLRQFKFHWSPTLLRRIHRLRSEGLVELVWCTTWCAEAQTLEGVFKFPPLKRAFTAYPKSEEDAWNYKRAAADEVLTAGRRLVWTDDVLPTEGPLRERFDADPNVLAITTRPSRGLTPDHLAAITAFVTLSTKVAEYRMDTSREVSQ